MVTLAVLQAVPTLMFWEVRRKDFWENMAHHIATIGLITYSYQVKCGPSHAKKDFMCLLQIVSMCQDPGQIESHAWPVCTQTGVGCSCSKSPHEAMQCTDGRLASTVKHISTCN